MGGEIITKKYALFTARIKKVGGSNTITIPRSVMDLIDVKDGNVVDVRMMRQESEDDE